ncbi:MAG: ATP synthase F1 subunit epsilon [Planctomycetota bacterium]|jgi:F-type H+-transporting ATPase subunit epsilon
MATTASNLTLRIVSPEEIILDAQVQSVQIPGDDGQFGVLPRHASMVALTESGSLHAKDSAGEPLDFIIHDGFAEVRDNVVTVLSRSAEKMAEIDLERAQKAAERARERMRLHDDDIDRARAVAALRRAMMRERLARRSS